MLGAGGGRMMAGAAPKAAAPAPAARALSRRGDDRSLQSGFNAATGDGAADLYAPAASDIGKPALAAEAEEAATQVLYRFPSKLTLAAGSTMMAPFIDQEIAAVRAWLYQPETNTTRPLAAVRLKNDSDSALPPGIITAFDTGASGNANFAGDAQLPLMPKGRSRFVTFALDSKTEIRRTDKGVMQTKLGKAVNGELSLTIKSRRTIEYEINAPADEDREIVIDEARAGDWKPAADSQNVEETTTRLRYTVSAPKGKTTKAALTTEHQDHQSLTLTGEDPEDMLTTISGLSNESQALKDAVARLTALVTEMNKISTHREELEKERGKIGEDQGRIRENLKTVGQGSDLGRRYLDMLKAQEDRLTAIAADEKVIGLELSSKRRAAEELVKALKL
jgi:hypothetical protein